MIEPLLQAFHLRRLFAGAGVQDASLSVQAGERVAILGRSGSGKSTLLAMLAGLCRPDSGEVRLQLEGAAVDLWAQSTAERCRLRRGPIGFVSQFTSLLPTLTTLENLLLPGQLAGQCSDAELRGQAKHWLGAVGLAARQEAMPGMLSGGEQRRAILARALMHRPALLLADEATSNLDESSEREIIALLEDLCRSQGTALLMVTHSQSLAQRCDRCLHLERGFLQPASAPEPAVPSLLSGASPVSGDTAPADPSRRRLLTAALFGAAGLWGASTLWSQHLREQRSQVSQERNRLQRAAFSGLSAELTTMEALAGGSYRGTIAIENLDPTQALVLLPLDLQVYIQQGARWNPQVARWSEGNRQAVRVDQPRSLRFDLVETPSSFTQLVPGYMHVRIDATYAVANRPDPQQSPVERRDSFFVYLLPPVPDPEQLARNGFEGEPPLFIPMPPH